MYARGGKRDLETPLPCVVYYINDARALLLLLAGHDSDGADPTRRPRRRRRRGPTAVQNEYFILLLLLLLLFSPNIALRELRLRCPTRALYLSEGALHQLRAAADDGGRPRPLRRPGIRHYRRTGVHARV